MGSQRNDDWRARQSGEHVTERQDTPEDFTAIVYSRHIIEELLGFPSKWNLETVADCITSISKTKKIPLSKAHDYLERAIRIAQKQGIVISQKWLTNGEYMAVRPEKPNLYDVEARRREAWSRHNCNAGWKMTDKGAIRCPQCREEKI